MRTPDKRKASKIDQSDNLLSNSYSAE